MKTEIIGNIQKMRGVLVASDTASHNFTNPTVTYHFIIGNHKIPLNPFLGNTLNLHFTGKIHCIQCQRETKKSFQQGYCFPCLQRLHECNLCIIHPEKCKVEEGRCSTDDWAHQQCHQQHIVYLANSSGLKVGITRANNATTRWIDQGARQGLVIYQVANRYQAGKIEVAFKKYVSDRTNWRNLLKQDSNTIDLIAERDRLMNLAQTDVQPQSNLISESKPYEINYPILEYPKKIQSLSFDNDPKVSGTLLGIKGQYLILDTGVINIRKFGGYEIAFE